MTLQQFKTYLQIANNDQDGLLQLIVDGVNAQIENDLGIYYGEPKTIVENYDTAPVIYLTHPDVTEITSIKRNAASNDEIDAQILLPASSYKFNKELGRVVLSNRYGSTPSRSGYDEVQITYKYGRSGDIPSDLTLAALALGKDWFNGASEEGGVISSESVGGYSISYAQMSKHEDVFKRYRFRRV